MTLKKLTLKALKKGPQYARIHGAFVMVERNAITGSFLTTFIDGTSEAISRVAKKTEYRNHSFWGYNLDELKVALRNFYGKEKNGN